MNAVLLRPEHHWECPSCLARDVTHEPRPHTRMHACAGLRGMTAPMVIAGTRAEHRVIERQDYIGNEDVQYIPGTRRPVLAVETRFGDGQQHATAYAPVAHARVG